MGETIKGLVLAGGGARGSYQVGAYQALQEIGWRPDVITGTSVGCLNGALFVTGKVAQAVELWKSLDIHGVLEVPQGKSPEELGDFFLDVVRGGGLDLEPLGETIDRFITEEEMRTAPIRYGLVMTEMNTLKSIQCPLEQIPPGKLKEYMLASSACFPALRPRTIDGVKYIDGRLAGQHAAGPGRGHGGAAAGGRGHRGHRLQPAQPHRAAHPGDPLPLGSGPDVRL